MPLENAPAGSPGFSRNVATEVKAGKPVKQAVAIAYSKAGEGRHDAATVGSEANTVYGKGKIVKVNAESVIVEVEGKEHKLSRKQFNIMNDAEPDCSIDSILDAADKLFTRADSVAAKVEFRSDASGAENMAKVHISALKRQKATPAQFKAEADRLRQSAKNLERQYSEDKGGAGFADPKDPAVVAKRKEFVGDYYKAADLIEKVAPSSRNDAESKDDCYSRDDGERRRAFAAGRRNIRSDADDEQSKYTIRYVNSSDGTDVHEVVASSEAEARKKAKEELRSEIYRITSVSRSDSTTAEELKKLKEKELGGRVDADIRPSTYNELTEYEKREVASRGFSRNRGTTYGVKRKYDQGKGELSMTGHRPGRSDADEPAIGSEAREEMPEGVFLQPGERKYPVKKKRDGVWTYNRELLISAAREARAHGHDDIAEKADHIRSIKFGGDGEERSDAAKISIKDAKKLGKEYGERGNSRQRLMEVLRSEGAEGNEMRAGLEAYDNA